MWAFGCVLYELLTGKPAFQGDTVTEILAAVLRGEPDWTAATPTTVCTLLRRCLQKDKTLRLRDAGDACIEIQETLAAPTSSPPITGRATLSSWRPFSRVGAGPAPAPPLWRRLALYSAPALFVGASIAGALVSYDRPSPTPLPVTRLSFPLGEGQTFTKAGRLLLNISPDGTQMVYVANQRLYLRSMSELESRVIPGTEIPQGIVNPVFSPDGRSIVYWSGQEGFRAHDGSDLLEHSPPQVLRLSGQANALIVGEAQPARSELLAEHAVLSLEIIDHLALLLVDPARQSNNEEAERMRQRRHDAQGSRSDDEPVHDRITGHYGSGHDA
jgi:hypothetical protein